MGYHPRCRWRRRLSYRTPDRILRRCLTVVLILECLVGAGQLFAAHFPEAFVIRVEEGQQIDWFVPGEDSKKGVYEVFGIQFRFKDGEVRLYRSREEIKSH